MPRARRILVLSAGLRLVLACFAGPGAHAWQRCFGCAWPLRVPLVLCAGRRCRLRCRAGYSLALLPLGCISVFAAPLGPRLALLALLDCVQNRA
eukprot:9287525-Alexandrium_andersonii.AAC.1